MINEKKRLIPVEWDDMAEKRKYEAYIQVYASDRNFLLTDVVTVVSQCKASLQSINSAVNNENLTCMTKMMVFVDDAEHLRNLLANLRKISSVISVDRIFQ